MIQRNKYLMPRRNRKRIFLVVISIMAALLISRGNWIDRAYFIWMAEKTPGIESVGKYYNYEGHRYLYVTTIGRGRIVIYDFDTNLFRKSDFFALGVIGNQRIICISEPDNYEISNAFNIVEFIALYKSLAPINNFEQLVSRYEEVSDLIKQEIGGVGKRFEFSKPESRLDKIQVNCKSRPYSGQPHLG